MSDISDPASAYLSGEPPGRRDFPRRGICQIVSDRGLRRDAVQVPAQVTITMAGYKSIPNQSELGCLSHVSKSLDS